MPATITHAYVAPGTNSPDSGKIAKDRWNAGHSIANLHDPCFYAYLGTNFTLTEAALIAVPRDTEFYDYGNCYDTSTGRFTPNVAGLYMVYWTDLVQGNANFVQVHNPLLKNGSEYNRPGMDYTMNGSYWGCTGCTLVQMNGTTDYVIPGVLFQTYGALGAIDLAAASYTTFGAHLIR